MPYLILIIYLALALALQFLTGSFPVELIAFPLNLVLFFLWAFVLVLLWKSRRKSTFVRFMLDPGATYVAIGLFLVFCLVVGITGYRWLTGTWPFVAFMLYFQTVLAFVIMRGWREATATGARLGAVRWRFLFLHAGLLLALASAFWGAPDSDELKLQAFRDVSVSEAYREDGTVRWLDYSLTLEDFDVAYGADGVPSDYTAIVRIGDEAVRLRVNHPYSVNFGEDVYLSGYDVDGGDYCVIQIVREPCRYGALAGMIMMITGAFLLFIGGPRRRYSDND
jgi:hypothetical protein